MAQLGPLVIPKCSRKKSNNQDLFEKKNDLQLYREFWFDKEGIDYLVNLLQNDRSAQDQRGKPLPPKLIIMSSLLYLTTNTFQIRIANEMSIHQTTVSSAVTSFCKAITQRVNEFVYLPRTLEERSTRNTKRFLCCG